MERNKNLIEQYPWLCSCIDDENGIPNDYDYRYTLLDELPLGWRDLILELCKGLRDRLIEHDLLDKYRVAEAKEKWHMLRWYDYLTDYESMPDDIVDLVSEYERRSRSVCLFCGRPKLSTEPCCTHCATTFF